MKRMGSLTVIIFVSVLLPCWLFFFFSLSLCMCVYFVPKTKGPKGILIAKKHPYQSQEDQKERSDRKRKEV